MELFLIRHAIADDSDESDDDFSRPLSPKGRKRFAHVVRGLKSFDIEFKRLLHSPKLRALETAQMLAPLVVGELEVSPLLTEEPSPALLESLQGEVVAVVGHEPHLSSLAAWLTVGDVDAGNAFELKKGGVIQLSGDPEPRGMRLVALLPPAVFRELGEG